MGSKTGSQAYFSWRPRLFHGIWNSRIDEFGFEKLERREYPDALSLLFKVVQCRNRRSSTALVTNIDPKDWADYLGDPPLAMALLDRIVDAAIIYRFEGKSYRDHRSKPHRKPK